ncbi:hypothetical protein [Cereibacter johrii]|uniref:hypothetical protein n=1 Tax=Cereibacter johrii TaxID=445629 RepID=UPI000DCC3C8A|nr:hypothetical protein [Cereibacter johrii]RAZ83424.1 hypothetical protein DDV93_14030 [Cereibacter johrii]
MTEEPKKTGRPRAHRPPVELRRRAEAVAWSAYAKARRTPIGEIDGDMAFAAIVTPVPSGSYRSVRLVRVTGDHEGPVHRVPLDVLIAGGDDVVRGLEAFAVAEACRVCGYSLP